ncbi:hypothetical protein KAH81_04125 [bacterium]|nr:hypothetical protein [bacterium]
MNYQGKLTEPEGVAFADSSRVIGFQLFDVPAGPAFAISVLEIRVGMAHSRWLRPDYFAELRKLTQASAGPFLRNSRIFTVKFLDHGANPRAPRG